MKRYQHKCLAVIPLISLLCMSPAMLEMRVAEGRSIASVKEEVKGRPRYEKLVEKVKPEDARVELSSDEHKDKLGGLKLKLLQEREQFAKNLSDETLVSDQRKSLETLVAESVLIEGALKNLQEKKEIEDEDAKIRTEVLSESKDIIESLLTDLEANEVLVAKAKEPKREDRPVVSDKPVVTETPVVVEKPKEEPKKEEPKKEEPKKEEKICESEEKNKVLTKQVEELLKQQNQILQTMVGMAQMMVSLHQQQQQNPFYQNGPGWNQSPYQYHQPSTAGNWVYYPSGFQPQQVNIFQQPSIYQYQMPQKGGIFPDQIYGQQQMPQQQYQQPGNVPMPQYNWAIQPDPRFNIQMNTIPGNFGQSLNGFGFNMSPAPLTSFVP